MGLHCKLQFPCPAGAKTRPHFVQVLVLLTLDMLMEKVSLVED
jgi:hypothetical protein